MPQYARKPRPVCAFQWTGSNVDELLTWMVEEVGLDEKVATESLAFKNSWIFLTYKGKWDCVDPNEYLVWEDQEFRVAKKADFEDDYELIIRNEECTRT